MTEFRDLVEKLNLLCESAPDTLTATEKARDISPVVGSATDPDHPFDGKLVGEDTDAVVEHDSGDEGAVAELRSIVDELHELSNRAARILGNHYPDALRQAQAYGALNFAGSSNRYDTTIESIIDNIENGEYDDEEDVYEDVLGDLSKKIGDVLKDVANSLEKDDKDLLDKPEEPKGDTIGPAVKTVKTDDGHEIKIHGNEDDGFRITIKNKPSKTKFENLDEAVMAAEMYCARKK